MSKIKEYTMKVTIEDGNLNIIRKNDGFSPYQLIGLLEQAKQDILDQMANKAKPDNIKRTIVIQDVKLD